MVCRAENSESGISHSFIGTVSREVALLGNVSLLEEVWGQRFLEEMLTKLMKDGRQRHESQLRVGNRALRGVGLLWACV